MRALGNIIETHGMPFGETEFYSAMLDYHDGGPQSMTGSKNIGIIFRERPIFSAMTS